MTGKIIIALLCIMFLFGCNKSSSGSSKRASSNSKQTQAAGKAAVHLPNISLADQSGEVKPLSSFLRKALVVYFYPKDDTPGCTTEAISFRDHAIALKEKGMQVVGVSTDDVESHKEFAENHSLSFPLLADVDEKLADALDVPVRLGFASRQTFLFDSKGVLIRRFEDVDPKTHVEEVLKAYNAHQTK